MWILFTGLSLGEGFVTIYPEAQLKGLSGWQTRPLFTVGEILPSTDPRFPEGYQPPGRLDGIGAFRLNQQTIRIFINHELPPFQSYPYPLFNGTVLVGARISFIDLAADRKTIINSGLAYTSVIDRQFQVVSHPHQINEMENPVMGFSGFCGGNLVGLSSQTNFVDPIYFVHEENSGSKTHGHGGSLWGVDIHRKTLFAIPAAGRLKWENTAELSMDDAQVALLISDDFHPRSVDGEILGAPLWLYLGKKNASLFEIHESLPRRISPPHDHFLNRNGLLVGKLYFFVSNDSRRNPGDFHGTGNKMEGHWHEIEVLDESMAGQSGYDSLGYKDEYTLRQEAKNLGAFQFLRPEGVSAHPVLGSRAVLASTGAGSQLQGVDNWGTVFQIDVNSLNGGASITILYDSDDAGGGQFPAPDFGLRNPDYVMWASDGMIYIQEDNASLTEPFGHLSNQEASIWQLNPQDSRMTRIAQIDRSVIVPPGVTDRHPSIIGHWESSGLFDATAILPTTFGEHLFLVDVQAYGIRDGVIKRDHLVQGGQLLLLFHSYFPLDSYP